HLGNCRTFVSFDILFRYLLHLGYKVRYVRNITDAGHLESDADTGEDKIAKRARLEQLEPMEIVQRYTVDFHKVMDQFNNLPPSIEPTATGHIIEQIEMAQKILENGYAYETDEAIYFDVDKFASTFPYGKLSGRNLDELIHNTRELEGQEAKKGKLDFALMIKAKPTHIMQWSSPWGKVFPGWHLECSAMSKKYLGDEFDIHGGGMDLIPTHHTNEIAQNVACCGKVPARFWVHTNMLTVNGQKMSKSLGNSFLPHELFSGQHPLLEKGYSPMTVRFFMLQAHYRSTLDFSNEALQAAEKGLARMMTAIKLTASLHTSDKSDFDITQLKSDVYSALNDDLNTPVAIAHLFDAVRFIYSVHDGKASITQADRDELKEFLRAIVFDVFGLKEEENAAQMSQLEKVVQILLDMRSEAKARKDFDTADKIRDALLRAGIRVNDGKESVSWSLV
ncbi:MAG: cysteine--tRNA ligase, partial [Chitinophagales bacterium]|nr:cysteine--tRNA ligase [Chitinophagales bacterium]